MARNRHLCAHRDDKCPDSFGASCRQFWPIPSLFIDQKRSLAMDGDVNLYQINHTIGRLERERVILSELVMETCLMFPKAGFFKREDYVGEMAL